jgi:hypothetical protein
MVQRHHPTKHSSIRIHRKYSVDVRRADYVDDVVVFWYYTHRVGALRGLCQRLGSKYASMSNEAMLQDALRHMPLHRLVRERLEEFKSCWWSRPVIGVHVRHTDRQTDVDRYWRPLRAFLQRDPQATVFVATDDIGVLQLYERQVPRVISTPKWYPKQGSMHQNKACPNRLENAVEALVDMYLLAECDYLIYPGGSTFSWVSHLLSDIPPGHVVDIERRDPIVWGKRLLRQFSA